jgi:RNA polymerase sigma factor (TIGR02999 family)
LLHEWHAGEFSAEARLFELVLPELLRLARYQMAGENAGHLLTPRALLNETYLRLVKARGLAWENRRHFFAVAARTMRRCLIEHARSRRRRRSIPLDLAESPRVALASPLETAAIVGRLLDQLEKENPEGCAVVELKFFDGLTDQEAAAALNLPLRSVQRRWHEARAWLRMRLRPHEEEEAAR